MTASTLLLVLRHWYPSAAGQLRGAVSTHVIVAEQLGTDSPTLVFGTRLGGRLKPHLRMPAATVRSVRWEPDSGSITHPPTKQWLVILDARKDATPELATLAEQQRQLVARHGPRVQALFLTQDSKRAEREGLRLVEFLRSIGLTLELDPTPSVDDPDTIVRATPPTSPDEVGEPVRSAAHIAAAARRVRWRVVRAE